MFQKENFNKKKQKQNKQNKRKLYFKTFTDHSGILSCFVRETSTCAK